MVLKMMSTVKFPTTTRSLDQLPPDNDILSLSNINRSKSINFQKEIDLQLNKYKYDISSLNNSQINKSHINKSQINMPKISELASSVNSLNINTNTQNSNLDTELAQYRYLKSEIPTLAQILSHPSYDSTQFTSIMTSSNKIREYKEGDQNIVIIGDQPLTQHDSRPPFKIEKSRLDLPAFLYQKNDDGKLTRILVRETDNSYNTDSNYGIGQQWLLFQRQGDQYDRLPEWNTNPEQARKESFSESGISTVNDGMVWGPLPRLERVKESVRDIEFQRLLEYHTDELQYENDE
jgi:hypothetical protein